MSKSRFSLYRYQLLPKDRYFQGDLYGISSLDELLSKKNDIFWKALDSPKAFKGGRSEVSTQKVFSDDDFAIFRVAVNRAIEIETQDFNSKAVDNWPKILVAVWNHPDKQLIAIQRRSKAFQNPRSVVKILAKSIEEIISSYSLILAIEPVVEKTVFWDLVKKYAKKIKKVEFELVTPNMAAISKTLPQNIKDMAKKSNAVKSSVTLESANDSALVLDSKDPVLHGLADYASGGGGNVSITLSGAKKKIHTASSVREIEISDAKLEGDPEAVAAIFKSIFG